MDALYDSDTLYEAIPYIFLSKKKHGIQRPTATAPVLWSQR